MTLWPIGPKDVLLLVGVVTVKASVGSTVELSFFAKPGECHVSVKENG